MLIRVTDFETTGTPEDPEAVLCEIGWCDLEARFGDPIPDAVQCWIAAPVSFLVNPGKPMPAVARAVHHISDADVANARTPGEGLMTLGSARPLYYCAHNAPFEEHFFPGAGVPWICTYRAAVRLWPDAPAHSNQVLRYHLGLEIADETLALPAHRAAPDAYVTAHLLAFIFENNLATIDQMVRWSGAPPLLHKVMFGKHRGTLWQDLPTDYLQWIADKSDLDADTKANARYRLKQRMQA